MMYKSTLLKAASFFLILIFMASCSLPDTNTGDRDKRASGSSRGDKNSPADYVNPFIGTRYFGHTFPGASLPWAMVHVSPDCQTAGWTYAAGYTWADNTIMGFSHTHYSGVGMTSGGDILFQPTVGNKLADRTRTCR